MDTVKREKLRNYFDRLWRYSKGTSDPQGRMVFEFLLEASDCLSHHANGIIVDAGAGQSRYKPFFVDAGRYVALDFGQGDIRWDYSQLDAIGDLAQLPLKDQSVDLILNTSTLEHVKNPWQVISEFYRILRPGGRVFLHVPFACPEHQIPHDYYRYSRFALRYLLEASAFEIEYVRPTNGVFYSAYYFLAYASGHIPVKYLRGIIQRILIPLVKPLFCYLDRFDEKRHFPLTYLCRAIKPITVQGQQEGLRRDF